MPYFCASATRSWQMTKAPQGRHAARQHEEHQFLPACLATSPMAQGPKQHAYANSGRRAAGGRGEGGGSGLGVGGQECGNRVSLSRFSR